MSTESATINETREKRKKKRTEMGRRQRSWSNRTVRFLRRYWFWLILGTLSLWAYLSPTFLAFAVATLSFLMRMVGAIGFVLVQFIAIFWFMSRSKIEIITPEDAKALTFDDYKGQPRLLELVGQWISLLEDRSKFKEMGGEYINGLLLYGAPGTGKTMLAKCMAGESDIAFISIEGSGFRAMFWGVDVLKMINFISRARRLAREYGACIAFIDEIDAVGASRGGVMGGGGATMGAGGAGGMMGGGTGALTRLLYEMDGVGELTRSERTRGRLYKLFGRKAPEREWHVLFMGSTNRPDVLDPALTRPGRFDRMIEVAPPDRTGRTAIIEYYLSRIKHDDTIDIEAIVADTSGYTPAQIMSAITKDAVRIALFDNRNKVNQRDIDSAFQEQAMGLENPIEDMREDQRQQVAYHEAGHAVAVYYLMPEQRIVRATIIRRSHALGYVHSAENYELHSRRLSWYVRRILVSLSGDVATKIWDEEAWTGAAGGDFINVRNSIYALAANGYFGPPVTDPKAGVYSWNLTEHESKFTRFWNQAEEKTTKMLRDHWEEVEAIALALLEKGDLTGKEVVEIIQDITGVYSRPGEEERIDELIEESSVSEPSPNGGKKQKKAAKPKAKKKKEVGSPAGD